DATVTGVQTCALPILIDDLPDLLLRSVGQCDPRAVGEASEHDADLLAQLVDEHGGRLEPAERAGQLAHRLGHQAGLEADVRIPQDRKSTRLNSSHGSI